MFIDSLSLFFRLRLVAGFLLLAGGLFLLAGCAKAPLIALEEARLDVASAEAIGARDWSPGEYDLAVRALDVAERQIDERKFRAAHRTLALAQRYAESARLETEKAQRDAAQVKQRIAAEQERLAEEQRKLVLEQEQARRRELEERQRQQQARAPAPTAPAATQPPTPEPPSPVRVEQYEVREGQSLAAIAALPEVYNDKLLWPLIYRANRDQIKAPQEIFSGQLLTIPRDKNREELEAAREEARELNLF